MLIRFTVENWASFCSPATLTMTAGKQRTHKHRTIFDQRYNLRLLPVTAIYGANASGKSNFFTALVYAQDFILNGSRTKVGIPVDPFRLDAASASTPTKVEFAILCGDQIYEYSFSVTREKVIEERLVEVNPSSERVLYHRNEDKIRFAKHFEGDSRLGFVFEGTNANQLYLTNSVSQKVNQFSAVHTWFRQTLQLIKPDTKFSGLSLYTDETHPGHAVVNRALQRLDTGIVKTGGVEIPIDAVPIDEADKRSLLASLEDGVGIPLQVPGSNQRISVKRSGDQLRLYKMATYHHDRNGEEVVFDLVDESDGTCRLLDLLPAFTQLCTHKSPRVFVIDELDRSLHSLLIYNLLEEYLMTCNESGKSQLVFTTHDLYLMDQDLLRRDELWLTEREESGNSRLYSFDEFKDIRTDKDIRKSYTLGRMGGVPTLRLFDTLSDSPTFERVSEIEHCEA